MDFARAIAERGFTIISTGGTAKAIADAGIDVIPIEEITGFPEMLDDEEDSESRFAFFKSLNDLLRPMSSEEQLFLTDSASFVSSSSLLLLLPLLLLLLSVMSWSSRSNPAIAAVKRFKP